MAASHGKLQINGREQKEKVPTIMNKTPSKA